MSNRQDCQKYLTEMATAALEMIDVDGRRPWCPDLCKIEVQRKFRILQQLLDEIPDKVIDKVVKNNAEK